MTQDNEAIKRTFRLKARGYVGRSIFDPNLRGERRTWDIEAVNEQEVRELFAKAISEKVPNVFGVGPFKIESIEPIESPCE